MGMTNRIYERLKNNEYFNFKDKMTFDEAENCLTIVLHEYLSIQYFEGNYTACYDEGYMCYAGTEGESPMSSLTHCHIQDDDEALEAVIAFANIDEDDIFIEDVRRFAWTPLTIMTKKRFEKKKAKYMAKKHLRIYSANAIIKRNA